MNYLKSAAVLVIVLLLGVLGCSPSNSEGSKKAASHLETVETKLSTSVEREFFKINSSKTAVNIASILNVVSLSSLDIDDGSIRSKVVVVDLGSASDLSPAQKVYFTIYRKGEMFTSQAVFDLGSYLSLMSVEVMGDNLFKMKVSNVNVDMPGITQESYVIDARKAIETIKKIDCGNDFDCERSKNFKASVMLRQL